MLRNATKVQPATTKPPVQLDPVIVRLKMILTELDAADNHKVNEIK